MANSDVCESFANKIQRSIKNREITVYSKYDNEKKLCFITLYDSTSYRLARERNASMMSILSFIGYDPEKDVVVSYDLNRIVPGRFFEARKPDIITVDFRISKVTISGNNASTDDFIKLLTEFFSQ